MSEKAWKSNESPRRQRAFHSDISIACECVFERERVDKRKIELMVKTY